MYIGYSLRGTKSCNKKEKRKKKKTEDIDKHFKKFERLANIRGWSERNKKVFKRGCIQIFIRDVLKGDGATTWAEAKRAMKRKFEKDEDDWLHILEKTNGRK